MSLKVSFISLSQFLSLCMSLNFFLYFTRLTISSSFSFPSFSLSLSLYLSHGLSLGLFLMLSPSLMDPHFLSLLLCLILCLSYDIFFFDHFKKLSFILSPLSVFVSYVFFFNPIICIRNKLLYF